MARTLQDLFQFLDALQERAPLERLTKEVAQLDISCDDVKEFVRFGNAGYQRNLIKSGLWYNVWAMCWKNGQRSPIHDHGHSTCAVRVLRGTLTETYFEFAPNGHIKAMGSRDLVPGQVCGTQDDDMHQISNLQAGNADLVTLHIYSPPLWRMATFSLLDMHRGEDVWADERKFVTRFPENSETPLESINSWVTPNRLFFVRNHFDMPAIERSAWRLRIEGCVEKAREWSWEELGALPMRSVFATVECAGNGRSFLSERHPGVQWGAGAIGHAEWTGVPLSALLEQSGVQPGAVEVLFEGADRGSEADHPEPMNFTRSLPFAKAMHPDTLLVLRMNGEYLQPIHGYPLRLFVPGWYGVASVKWLRRIQVLDKTFHGYYQSVKYTYQRRAGNKTSTEIIGPMAVKSEIARPTAESVLGLGTHRIFGIAWAGEEPVGCVQVSVDCGQSWSPAELISPRAAYCWTLWEYLWEVAEPGEYTLLTRAISEKGRMQPTEHDPLFGGYMIHFSRPIPVRVESRADRGLAVPRDLDTLVYDMNAFAEEMSRMRLDVEMEFSAGEGI